MKTLYSGEQANKYTKFADKSYSWKFLEKPTITRNLKSIINGNIHTLDAGCGTGRSIRVLLELGANPIKTIGTDISPHMLKIARKSFPEVKFVKGNLPDLKLNKNSLELVSSNMAFHYLNLSDFKTTVEHIHTWLLKGGYLFYIVVHPLRFIHNHSQYFSDKSKVEKTPWGTEIKYYPKRISDYVNTTLDSGFDVIKVEEPIPVGGVAKKDIAQYKKYLSNPTRLAILAVKK
ncbi:MAG TPA: class I SAM-dependent methyltransferase [Patescibacteria group bacterium]|nr:class I SAM-dependent methyltransferase [Patescibacteria group bacterium]